jgi:hypothetical protein
MNELQTPRKMGVIKLVGHRKRGMNEFFFFLFLFSFF